MRFAPSTRLDARDGDRQGNTRRNENVIDDHPRLPKALDKPSRRDDERKSSGVVDLDAADFRVRELAYVEFPRGCGYLVTQVSNAPRNGPDLDRSYFEWLIDEQLVEHGSSASSRNISTVYQRLVGELKYSLG
jgi:hypothetical protein